jgi:hypothetical protein
MNALCARRAGRPAQGACPALAIGRWLFNPAFRVHLEKAANATDFIKRIKPAQVAAISETA